MSADPTSRLYHEPLHNLVVYLVPSWDEYNTPSDLDDIDGDGHEDIYELASGRKRRGKNLSMRYA
jgi:hypothetical protein